MDDSVIMFDEVLESYDEDSVKMSDKDVNIKKHIYHLFDNAINTKDFDPNNIKIDEKSCKKYLLHCICDDQKFEICKNE